MSFETEKNTVFLLPLRSTFILINVCSANFWAFMLAAFVLAVTLPLPLALALAAFGGMVAVGRGNAN